MTKKFCDKCKKEILNGERYYEVSVWKYPEKRNSDEAEKEIEVCHRCYKEIKI